jgi:hypothetical protein
LNEILAEIEKQKKLQIDAKIQTTNKFNEKQTKFEKEESRKHEIMKS